MYIYIPGTHNLPAVYKDGARIRTDLKRANYLNIGGVREAFMRIGVVPSMLAGLKLDITSRVLTVFKLPSHFTGEVALLHGVVRKLVPVAGRRKTARKKKDDIRTVVEFEFNVRIEALAGMYPKDHVMKTTMTDVIMHTNDSFHIILPY